jgi:hypothetical protein
MKILSPLVLNLSALTLLLSLYLSHSLLFSNLGI